MSGSHTSSSSRVVVVDDDRQVRDSLVELLSSIGCKVIAYESGKQFLDHVQDDDPRCAVVDLRLPDMSGLDIQVELAARSIHLPLIVLSGNARPLEVQKALSQGAMAVLEKPVDPQLLIQQIRRAVFGKP